MTSVSTPTTVHDPYQALRHRDFLLFIISRFVATLGEQMIAVAIGWELYERTNSELALGLVGLVEVLPVLLLALPAGHVADRFTRKYVMVIMEAMLILCAIGLAAVSYAHGPLIYVYLCMLLVGVAGAFAGPAGSAFLPQTVPPEAFTNAATWNSSAWQLAAVIGPALGGLIIALQGSVTLGFGSFGYTMSRNAGPVYILEGLASGLALLLILFTRTKQVSRSGKATSLKSLAAGVSFVRQTKVFLAAITLDMFAVLLGGATTLLPVFAKDILNVGPVGLGWLRAAPSIGAILMAVVIAHQPPFKRAGRALLWAVAGFGAATIVFGLSRSFILSVLMLGTLGAVDNISVVIRATLLLVKAPDEVRGRVAAVNSVFIGTSNQLGGFESGLTAQLFGPVASVVAGGIGTLLVVCAVAWVWPEIRRLGELKPD